MKKVIANQDKLFSRMMKDIETVPKFIDGKTDLHKFRLMQSILYAFMKLSKPVFLSAYQIEQIDYEVIEYTVQLTTLCDESLNSLIVVYLNKKLMGYYDLAMEYELFECASNIKKFFERVE